MVFGKQWEGYSLLHSTVLIRDELFTHNGKQASKDLPAVEEEQRMDDERSGLRCIHYVTSA